MQAIGYKYITEKYGLGMIPHFCSSYRAERGTRRTIERSDGHVEEIFTRSYDPGSSDWAHLEFALKYEGMNLHLLKMFFAKTNPANAAAYVRSKPVGIYSRKLWFLYEFLLGRTLDVPDLDRGNYVDLLDPQRYYITHRVQSRRHRVNDNLPGTVRWCPLIRRSPRLTEFEQRRLNERVEKVLGRYSPQLLQRALSQLYTAETRSSFEIERETPSRDKTLRFMQLLSRAGAEQMMNREGLLRVQRAVLGGDDRFAAQDYRSTQEYVSSLGSIDGLDHVMHLVPPKPGDVSALMDGLCEAYDRMLKSGFPPVLLAAAVSFGFVFIHPFTDGNGRVHRFLIHHILARAGFTRAGIIFPVSAVMVRQPARYQEALNSFSRPLLDLIRYHLDGDGHMTVEGETSDYYRYIDFTTIAERLYEFIEQTIEVDFVRELDFLERYDRAMEGLKRTVDGLSDREFNRFIVLTHANHGALGRNKRQKFFPALTDEEVARMEEVVRASFDLHAVEAGPESVREPSDD